MTRKLIETQWSVFSKNFVKFHRLPFGTELRLFDSNGRKKRSDFLVKRKRINSKTTSRAKGDDNIRDFLDSASRLLSTNLKARGLRLELYGPDGELVHGNTHVCKVREMEPLPTTDDIERMEADELLISEIQSTARSEIIESEYLIDDPSTIVCSGYMRALVERYGRPAVLAALGN